MSLHLESPQRPVRATEGLIGLLLGYYLVTTWLLLGYYLVYYLVTTWLLLEWGLMVGFVRVEAFRQ